MSICMANNTPAMCVANGRQEELRRVEVVARTENQFFSVKLHAQTLDFVIKSEFRRKSVSLDWIFALP